MVSHAGAVAETLKEPLWFRVVAAIYWTANTAMVKLPRMFSEASCQLATSFVIGVKVVPNHNWKQNIRFDFHERGVSRGDACTFSERIVQEQNALRLQLGGCLVCRWSTCTGTRERYVAVTKLGESVNNAHDGIPPLDGTVTTLSYCPPMHSRWLCRKRRSNAASCSV